MNKSNAKVRTITAKDFRQFVEAAIQPQLRPIAMKFWEMVRRQAPELVPGMRGGTEKYIPIPVWRLDRDVMVLSPSTKALTVSFVDGAKFDDPQGLLGGAGKTSRTLKLKSLTDLEDYSVAGFLKEAVNHSPRAG